MNPATPLILASASPRRRELLACLGIPFSVAPADVDETIPERIDEPAAFARRLAREKARIATARRPSAAVLAADTIVVHQGRILGKPGDADEARATLRALRSDRHEVTTAIALAHSGRVWLDHATTTIHMRDYSDAEIETYIDSGDPFDKAGSYAIQDRRFKPAAHCEGCYCNVVGLPIVLTQRLLRDASVPVLDLHPTDLPAECRLCPFVDPAGQVQSSG